MRRAMRASVGVLFSKFRISRFLGACALSLNLLGGFGCESTVAPSGVPESDGDASITQWSREFRLPSNQSSDATWVMLVLVDDAPTEEARALRAFLADEVIGSYRHNDEHSCGLPKDPARWQPQDIRVVLVSPSDPERTLTSETNPELALISPDVTDEEIARWEKGIGDAILDSEAPERKPLLALAELEHWSLMLAGRAEARTESERRFMATLPADFSWDLAYGLLATTRDDQSPGAAASYETNVPLHYSGLYWNASQDSSACGFSEAPPRLAALGGYWSNGPCDQAGLFRGGVITDCFTTCLGFEPVRREDGQADCRMFAYARGLGPCPAWAGWVDPMDDKGERVPRTVETEYGERRVCEILQLEGDARESCETDRSCADCEAGFCFAKSLFYEGCATWDDLRFPMGADTAEAAYFEVTCNVRPADDPLNSR